MKLGILVDRPVHAHEGDLARQDRPVLLEIEPRPGCVTWLWNALG
jgi:hypothetical protein